MKGKFYPISIFLIYLVLQIFSLQAMAARHSRGHGWKRMPRLKSHMAVVLDNDSGQILYRKNSQLVKSIASITKLMSAMVAIDAQPNWRKIVTIQRCDRDTIRWSRSRLKIGQKFTRKQLLKAMLIGSDNRAAFALARSIYGSKKDFVSMMNQKARRLNIYNTNFADPAGLRDANQSNAQEVAILAHQAFKYPLIRKISRKSRVSLLPKNFRRRVQLYNPNRLTRNRYWGIEGSKTGYTSNAGYCLVMEVKIKRRNYIFVFLNSAGKFSRLGDSQRVKGWLRKNKRSVLLARANY